MLATVVAVPLSLMLGACTSAGSGSSSADGAGAAQESAGTAAPPGPSFRPAERDQLQIPRDGAYFGIHFSASLPDRRGALEDLEKRLGRRVTLDHVYHRFDDPFPAPYDRWTVEQGRTPFLSWSCRLSRGAGVDLAEIAAGGWDTLIDARARAVADLGRPVLMSFCHEPATYLGEDRAGTAQEYVRAWRHIAERFDASGTTNVSWVWTLTAFAFRTGEPESLYPGDDIVDWVGVDGYVNVGCPWLNVPWATWTETFSAAEAFARQHRKPLVVAEFSLREDPQYPERKRQWLEQARSEIEAMPQTRAVVGFNSTQPCSDYVASTPNALEGLRSLAGSDYLSTRPRG